MIETERLRLREYTPEDYDALFEILSDEETMAHYPQPFDPALCERFLACRPQIEALYNSYPD